MKKAATSPRPCPYTTMTPVVATTMAPVSAPTMAPSVVPTMLPVDPTTVDPTIVPPVDPTMAPVDPTMAPVDPTMAPASCTYYGTCQLHLLWHQSIQPWLLSRPLLPRRDLTCPLALRSHQAPQAIFHLPTWRRLFRMQLMSASSMKLLLHQSRSPRGHPHFC
jgi:hypothetical protein